MKLMKLKLQGPSLAMVLPQTLGEAPGVFIYNSIFFYLKKLLSIMQALGPTKLSSAIESTILF